MEWPNDALTLPLTAKKHKRQKQSKEKKKKGKRQEKKKEEKALLLSQVCCLLEYLFMNHWPHLVFPNYLHLLPRGIHPLPTFLLLNEPINGENLLFLAAENLTSLKGFIYHAFHFCLNPQCSCSKWQHGKHWFNQYSSCLPHLSISQAAALSPTMEPYYFIAWGQRLSLVVDLLQISQ